MCCCTDSVRDNGVAPDGTGINDVGDVDSDEDDGLSADRVVMGLMSIISGSSSIIPSH